MFGMWIYLYTRNVDHSNTMAIGLFTIFTFLVLPVRVTVKTVPPSFSSFCGLVVRVLDFGAESLGFDPSPAQGDYTLGQYTLHIIIMYSSPRGENGYLQ